MSKRKLILQYMINNVNSDNKILMNNTKLSRKLNVSRKTISNNIKYFTKQGYIKHIERHGVEGSTYTINSRLISNNSNNDKNMNKIKHLMHYIKVNYGSAEIVKGLRERINRLHGLKRAYNNKTLKGRKSRHHLQFFVNVINDYKNKANNGLTNDGIAKKHHISNNYFYKIIKHPNHYTKGIYTKFNK